MSCTQDFELSSAGPTRTRPASPEPTALGLRKSSQLLAGHPHCKPSYRALGTKLNWCGCLEKNASSSPRIGEQRQIPLTALPHEDDPPLLEQPSLHLLGLGLRLRRDGQGLPLAVEQPSSCTFADPEAALVILDARLQNISKFPSGPGAMDIAVSSGVGLYRIS